MEQEQGLLIIKLTQSDYLRTLENAIQFGKPVLCENVLEQVSTLSPGTWHAHHTDALRDEFIA